MIRGSGTILLVEDSEPLRKLVKTYLDSAGFRVFSAESGEAALELFTRIGVTLDLLLTDVVMPGMNGRALAEHLLPRVPGMKVLCMSGYSDTFIAGHGVLDAGTHLLHKPFTEEVFLRKVREVLDAGRRPVPASDPVSELVGNHIRPGR